MQVREDVYERNDGAELVKCPYHNGILYGILDQGNSGVELQLGDGPMSFGLKITINRTNSGPRLAFIASSDSHQHRFPLKQSGSATNSGDFKWKVTVRDGNTY